MNKEFVKYEQAVALKELGFDEPCIGYYDHQIKELDTISSEVCERLCKHDTHIKAPTFSQAFRWFREKGIYFEIVTINVNKQYEISIPNDLITGFKTYEEAEQACLDKLIEICKSKTNE